MPKNGKKPEKRKISQIKELGKAIENGIWNSDQWLFGLTAIGSILLILFYYVATFLPQYKIPNIIIIVYIGILTGYATHKELKGWTSSTEEIKIRPGELFVAVWVLTGFIMAIIEFVWKGKYTAPESLPEVIGAVSTVFIGRIISKEIRKRRKKGKS